MKEEPSSLIERLLQGDSTSFDDVVSWYSKDVLRLAYLLLWDREDALDVLQETLLRFVRRVKKGKFAGRNGSVKGFLLTCARNLCIDRLRSRNNFIFSLDDTPENESRLQNLRTPFHHAEESQFAESFEEALSKLNESQRTVLVLFDIKGDSYNEIAETVNIPVSKVKSDLFRARKKLRQFLWPFEQKL